MCAPSYVDRMLLRDHTCSSDLRHAVSIELFPPAAPQAVCSYVHTYTYEHMQTCANTYMHPYHTHASVHSHTYLTVHMCAFLQMHFFFGGVSACLCVADQSRSQDVPSRAGSGSASPAQQLACTRHRSRTSPEASRHLKVSLDVALTPPEWALTLEEERQGKLCCNAV